MCDPVTAAAAASTVIALGGAKLQYDAAKAEGAANKADAEERARLAEIAADDAITMGAKAAHQQRIAVKQFIGTQRTQLAGSGIEVNTGTAADLQAETAFFGEMDAIQIEVNAEKEATAQRNQAGFYLGAGANAASAARLKGQASILQGAGSVANTYLQYRQLTG